MHSIYQSDDSIDNCPHRIEHIRAICALCIRQEALEYPEQSDAYRARHPGPHLV